MQWALFLSEYNYTIIVTPRKQNTANVLSWQPDHKEGIASNDAEHILLTSDKFCIQALQTTAIPIGIDADLKQTIQTAIEADTLMGQKLKNILLSGPRSVAKGL